MRNEMYASRGIILFTKRVAFRSFFGGHTYCSIHLKNKQAALNQTVGDHMIYYCP